MTLWPTPYFQYVRRDGAAPSLVLQQWWAVDFRTAAGLFPPGTQDHEGVWRDVPIAELQELAEHPQPPTKATP